MRGNQTLSKLFTVGLVTPVVLDFYVQVEGPLAAVHLGARVVGANETAVDFFGCAAHVLLALLDLPGFFLFLLDCVEGLLDGRVAHLGGEGRVVVFLVVRLGGISIFGLQGLELFVD